jgi:peptidoglycan/xylan/chitin deacetylase (PgdA/CDA1 family)
MREEISIMLTAGLVIGLLGMLMVATPMITPVSAATWDPALGWDFECHTNTHANLKGSSEATIRAELEAVDTAFIAHGYPVPQHTAYPFGNYDPTVEGIVSQYRKTGRTVSGNMETYPVPNWYELKAAQLKRNTRFPKLQAIVDQAIATNALLHIFTHDVADKPSTWGAKTTVLIDLLDYLKAKQDAGQLQVMTMAEAYDLWSTATTNPKATVVVSFDDGYATDYTTVYPLFKTRGLKGTSYIFTSVIGQPGQLTWDQIALMRAGA